MESFRIGDVTIERVIPKTSPDETARAGASGTVSTSGTEGGMAETNPPGEKELATNGSPTNDSVAIPSDHVSAETTKIEPSGTENAEGGPDPPQDPGPDKMDIDDIDMKVEPVFKEESEKDLKDEAGEEDDEEEEEEDEDYQLDDDQDEHMSAQSGEDGDGKEDEDDEDDDEDEDLGEGEEEEDDEETLRELAEAVSRGEVEGEVPEGEGEVPEGEAGQEKEKKKVKRRKRKKVGSEEGGEGSEADRKKKRKVKKKKKGAGKDGAKDGEKEGTSEEASASEGEGGEKKKKKGKKGKKGKKKSEDGDDDDKAGDRKLSNLRRNIREVMDETQLDEATLAAQRLEMERLRRVQEQQRLSREYQRQMAQTRQNSKTEQRVLSLLQGNTSILKQVAGTGAPQSSASGSRSPSTVLVKLGGQSPQAGKKVVEVLRVPKGTTATPAKPGSALKPSVTRTLVTKPRTLTGAHMMTPSVSIAPVRSSSGMKPLPPMKHPLGPMQPPLGPMQPPLSGSEGEEDEEDEEEIAEPEERKPPRKGKDVVTISSSSSSEDCIVLSEPSDGGEEEEEEDPTNSGMHTNDLFNVPDEEGRVQVNMGKPEGDPDIFLAPHIARVIKPHQVGGIRFLFDNVVESIERFNTSPGFGCILAHSMGLGKTLQVISFCDIFLRHTPAKTVLCIMPINTLQNWMAEFNMWLPKDPLASPLSAHGEVRPRSFNIHVLNDSHKTLKARARVVDEWQREGGVLLIGYELYRLLSLKRPSKPKKSRRKKPIEEEEPLDPEEEEKKEKEMLEAVHGALVKPGPDLVICDEGHRIKNSHASISMALKQIRSKRRVVLTGYPLQNNLLEYWCMVDFVRPNYLGTKTEFCNMFERPIQNGQCIDSTPQDIRLMRYRAHVLHSLLEGFVQRRSHSVLQNSLPQKEEYVLLVRMTAFQRKLYDTFMNEVVRTKAVPNPLKAFAVCCKIWNHPDVLYQFLRKREGGEGVDLDLEEAAASLAPTTVEATEEGGVPGAPIPGAPPVTGGRSRAKGGRARNPGGAKGRRKGGAAANKPAAAVIPNTSSQPDSSGVFSGTSGNNYPPMHGQVNQNMMGSYNTYPPPPAQQGHSQYQPPFSSMSHHYPESNNSYGGYSSGGFSSSSLPMSGQGNFPNANVGYGESVPSQSSSFGSSSQQMFPSSNQPPSTPSSSQGYDSMSAPYFSGNSNSSGQHGMGDNFQPAAGYGQNWSGGNSNYNFNQSQQGSQSFPEQNYSQGGSFQGYSAPPSSGQGFSQNLYNAPSGSTSSSSATGTSNSNGTSTGGSSSTAPSTSGSGYQQQGMMGQPPAQQNSQQGMMMGNQGMMHGRQRMNAPDMMIPPSPVNSSGMLPGGAPSDDLLMPDQAPRSRRSFVQESPINASGMLPGGAPTKDLMMPGKNPGMLPGMGSSMGPRMMNDRMMPMEDSGMAALGPGMGPDGIMPHHGQDMIGMYSSQVIMGNQPLPSIGGADAPTAEDLLRSESEDFAPFDGSVDMMNKKTDMYGIKSRMFDPWANSHNQGYGMGNSYKQDNMKLDDSYTDMKTGIAKMKNDRDEKYPMDPTSLTELKSDLVDLKSKEALDSMDPEDRKWQVDSMEMIDKEKEGEMKRKEDGKEEEEEEPILGPDGKPAIEVTGPGKVPTNSREDPGIPYDWAVELMKDYVPGLIENSAKMAIFFCILEESLKLGDRILVFSQSLFTLSLIEEFLQRNYIPLPGVYERWQRNRTYYRLDGSTAALEREKLINEFNQNPGVHMFLVSTRAGSLGINLVGANRVVVFDASWNPCHDTQAVCRVYRYGQKKPCFVYRLVMDNCLEKKIYDRQINKQGMSDRVVDECNPDAHLSIKEVTNLCWDDEQETEVQDFSKDKERYSDIVMKKVLEKHGTYLSKVPFHHESLLVDRKDKKLSQAEKRLAKRSYEMEKRANNRPVYHYYNSGAQGGLQISRAVQRDGSIVKPIASVRPMQAEMNLDRGPGGLIRQGTQPGRTKWIPADVWQRQGMTAQEMTLPLDVVIPTNSPDRTSIVLKAGQRVMVLKSPKGIYMQLESGKIIAIRTAFKMGGNKGDNKMGPGDKDDIKKGILGKGGPKLPSGIHPLRNNPNITITPRGSPGGPRGIRPNVLQTRAVPTRLTSPMGRGGWHARPGLAGRGVTVRPSAPGLRPGMRPISPSVTVTPTVSRTPSASVTISPKLGPTSSRKMEDPADGSNLPGNQADSLGGSQAGSLGGSRPTSQAGSDDGQNSNSSQDIPNHSKSFKNSRVPPTHETDDLGEVSDKAWMDDDEDGPSAMGKAHDDEGSQNYLDAALSSHSQSSNFTTGSDYTEALPTSKSVVDANRGEGDDVDTERGTPPASEELTKSNKNFRHSTSRSNPGEVGNKNRDGNLSGSSMFGQNQAVNFSSGFTNTTASKSYIGGSFEMGSYRGTPEAEEEDKARPRKTSAANRGRKLSQYLEGDTPSSSMDSNNQWKSPQQFSPGISSKTTQQRSLESPAYDDNSNASANSNMSAKSANAPSDRLQPPAEDHYLSGYSNNGQPSKNQQASSTVTKTPVTSSSTLSNPPTPTPPTSTSSNFPIPPSTAPVMDPYLYGGYGSYPPPPSGYYSPYAHPMTAPPLHQQPYAPGFFPDRNAPAPSTAPAPPSTAPATPAASSTAADLPPAPAAPAKPESTDPSRHQSNSSKSSTTTESSKKGSSSRVPPPPAAAAAAAYDGRTSTTASSTNSSSRSPSSTPVPVPSVDPAAYPGGSSTTSNPYNPMMMSPSYNSPSSSSSSQYPAPPPPISSAVPPPATSPNPFSAAAAAAGNYPPSPYTAPYAYPGSNQFESDFARASMYSAFHRPDPGQFPAPGALDPAAPYLPPLPAHSRPMNPAYPPQNMYPGQYGGARDPYGQLPPYPGSPFMIPPSPYGGLPVSPATTPSASSTDQPQSQ